MKNELSLDGELELIAWEMNYHSQIETQYW